MVAHDPQLAGWNLHRIELAAPADRAVLVHVRLVQRPAVDRHPPLGVTTCDRVAAHTDDTFDEVLVTGRAEPEHPLDRPDRPGKDVARRRDQRLGPFETGAVAVEHDDLSAVDVPEAVDKLVDQYPVVDQQGALHRDGRYPERLDEERLDEQSKQKGDQNEQRQLAGERAATAARSTGWAPAGWRVVRGSRFGPLDVLAGHVLTDDVLPGSACGLGLAAVVGDRGRVHLVLTGFTDGARLRLGTRCALGFPVLDPRGGAGLLAVRVDRVVRAIIRGAGGRGPTPAHRTTVLGSTHRATSWVRRLRRECDVRGTRLKTIADHPTRLTGSNDGTATRVRCSRRHTGRLRSRHDRPSRPPAGGAAAVSSSAQPADASP